MTATLTRTTLQDEYVLTLGELQRVRDDRDRPEAELTARLGDIERQLEQAVADEARERIERYVPVAEAALGDKALINAALEYFRNAAHQLEQAVADHDNTVDEVTLALGELEKASPDNGRVVVAFRPFPSIDGSSVRAGGH